MVTFRVRRTITRWCVALLIGSLSASAAAQFCPAGTLLLPWYITQTCNPNTCWSPTPFPGAKPWSPGYYVCSAPMPVAGALESSEYDYDLGGNRVKSRDPLGRVTAYSYDVLNRLTQIVDPGAGTTKYAYNLNDALAQVTDPRNLATSYTINGFGETTTLASPDTGTTTSTYDAAGNLKTRLDARGVTATYTVDAINRVTRIAYGNGTTTETHSFTYDQNANGKGRLTTLTDTAGTTRWTYEGHGRVLTKAQTVGYAKTVGYAYNAAGQLATLTTPSGQKIGYSYSNNRIAGVTINGTPLISAAITEPFGPISTWQWGNGLVMLRVYDTDGRVTSWEYRNGTSILRNDVSWDVAGRVTGNTNPADATLGCVFQYDALDRLSVSQQGSPTVATQQFNYDKTGNRTNFTANGLVTNYSTAASSNQLLALIGATARSYVYDGAGNPTTIGGMTYTYNNANRLTKVMNGAMTLATYKVNALGQRVEKVAGGVTTRYVYDEHGHLLGEYDGAGKLIQETVWLEDMPVATLRPTGAAGTPAPIAVYYVLADHLGSPRAVVRPSDSAIMWRWDNTDPFGNNAANENPSGQGAFRYALRFPGQYFDAETSTHYNYFRDYDPKIGRYIESDPIGMIGGTNTFAYTLNAPTSWKDRKGLRIQIYPIRISLVGCGPNGKFMELLVPDYPLSFPFRGCCDTHDNCYDDCNRRPTRAECDKEFCSCLERVCLRYSNTLIYLVCDDLAREYCYQVKSRGGPPFDDSRRKCKAC